MSRDFYELCYDQYKQEMSDAEALYQRCGILLVVIPILATAMVTLGRLDVVGESFARVDVFLYNLAFVVASSSLLVSTYFLFVCVYPRGYKSMANMGAWQKWREEYQKHIDNSESQRTKAKDIDAAMFENLCPRLAEAQVHNASITEKRRQAFRRSILMAAICLVAIGFEATLNVVLTLQGI